jgi:AcrR family transcriptional regulator
MARTVDPELRRARRGQILEAAVTCFAAKGFDRTTIVEISATAGISSGSLFHYFPTKAAVFSAIFEEDTREMAEFFAAEQGVADPWGAVLAFVERSAAEAAEPLTAGLMFAAMSRLDDPDFAMVLAENERAIKFGLEGLLAAAQRQGRIRAEMPPGQLAGWVALVIDGFFSRVLLDPEFDAAAEAPVLRRLVERLADLDPPSGDAAASL